MGLSAEVLTQYRATQDGLAVTRRTERRFLEVAGRAPRDMLKGILSGRIPALPARSTDGGLGDSGRPGTSRGRVSYSAILNPKGRIITDLRVLAKEDGSLLLDLPQEGFEDTRNHFQRTLPPRLARVEDLTGQWSRVTVLGPEGAPTLEDLMAGIHVEGERGPEGLKDLVEGEAVVLWEGSAVAGWIVRDADLNAPALDVVGPAALTDRVVAGAVEHGATAVTPGILDLLRLERGRPRFGVDMDQAIIPVEAGIQDRAIDYEKGCYTGQEVIIRIRDRGHVNKHLRGFLLGNAPVPSSGSELFAPGAEKSVGRITTAACSPAFGQTIALGYARRDVAPGDELRVGGADGDRAVVCSLNDAGWVVDGGAGPIPP